MDCTEGVTETLVALVGEYPPASVADLRDVSLIPGPGRSP